MAIAVWGCYKTPLKLVVFVERLRPTATLHILPPAFGFVMGAKYFDKPVSSRMPLGGVRPASQAHAPSIPDTTNQISEDQPIVPAKAPPIASVTIPVPDRAPAPKLPESSAESTATIGGQPVRASDKTAGTIYVSIRLSDLNAYRGRFNQDSVDAAKKALEGTHKISVFLGTYDIGTKTGTRRYGVGGQGSSARTVYYLDRTLGKACTAVAKIVSDVIGMSMECSFAEIPSAPLNPNDINFNRDFFLTSGLDMEVVI